MIKVERHGPGDDTRAFPPFKQGESAYFATLNAGKQSLALDLKAAEDRALFDRLLARADVLHTPTVGMTAPPFEAIAARSPADVFPILARTARNTRPFSTLGMPAMSVPAGFCRAGLPIGFQLVGRPFAEGLLLRVADAYQRATDWHLRAPQQ